MPEKVSKKSVDYSHGMKAAHCGICTHFEKPSACSRVTGLIAPVCWCRLFERTG